MDGGTAATVVGQPGVPHTDAEPTPKSPPNSSSHEVVEPKRHISTDASESTQVQGIDSRHPQPSKNRASDVLLPESPSVKSVSRELFTWIKRSVMVQTNLPKESSALIAFWIISSWFPEAFSVFPCLVLTGSAHEAMVVLRLLKELCYSPGLMAGFKRADLKDVNSAFRTLLISEPNLNNQTAALLGSLTNRDFLIVEERCFLNCAGSRAIYIGEDPVIERIQHAIYVNVTTTPLDVLPSRTKWVQQTMANLPGHLLAYRKTNLPQVRHLEFNPAGLSPESHAVANALGSCIVDDPELRFELVDVLRPHDRQQAADRSDSLEALVASAALTLSHQGKNQIYVKEIANEVNRVQEDRGETLLFSPEKVGHKLKKIGLLTRTLSQVGKGLVLDGATKIRIHEVASAYMMEDWMEDGANLHCGLCLKNE